MRIWTHNSLRWVYTSWFLFLNLCSPGRCWGIAFSIFSFRFWLKDTLFFFFFPLPLKTSKTNYSWAQKSSSPTKRCLSWGSAADNSEVWNNCGPEWCFWISLSAGMEQRRKFRSCFCLCSHPATLWVLCQEPGNVGLLRALGLLCLPSLGSSSQGIIPSPEKLRNGKEQGKTGF